MATTNFAWDEISESQSGKFATHNSALAQIDGKVGRTISAALSDSATNNLAEATAWQYQFIRFTGTLTQDTKVNFPGGGGTDGGGLWMVRDETSGGYQLTLGYSTGTTYELPIGASESYFLVCGDTNNFFGISSYAASERSTSWSTSDLDFSERPDFYVRTISSGLTMTISNPILGRLINIELDSTASATLTLPGSVTVLSGTYDNTGTVNQIGILCIDADTPKYLATIQQE